MLVDGFPAGPLATNCYVVARAAGEECVVIDPGVGAENRLDDLLAEHRLKPVAVLVTHGHFDHVFAVAPVCGARGIPAYIHPADRAQLTDPWSAIKIRPGTPVFGRLVWSEPDDVRELAGAQALTLAGIEFQVDLAPGHTPGSITFATSSTATVRLGAGVARGAVDPVGVRSDGDGDRGERPVLFSGDLVFAGSIGRTDLPGGSLDVLLASLARVVLPMTDDTLVLSGHGPATTVGRERATNPYLRHASPKVGPRTGTPRTGT